MNKKPFSEIFDINTEGKIIPKVKVRIHNLTIDIGKPVIGKSLFIGGVNLHDYIDKDIEVEIEGDTYVLKF